MEKNITVCIGGEQIKSIPVTVKVDKSELDETIDKVKQLCDLLNKASSLIDELASKPDLKINLQLDGESLPTIRASE